MTNNDVLSTQNGNVNTGLVVTTKPFVPPSEFAELEAARATHEQALEEYRGREARRVAQREEERQLQEHLQRVQEAKQEAKRDGDKALRNTVKQALRVVADHGPEWLQTIAEERAAALAERDEHLAKAAEAEARAYKNNAVEAWLLQASTETVPQPFRPAERAS
jgi:hypothetical protein